MVSQRAFKSVSLLPPWVNLVGLALCVVAFGVEVHLGEMGMAGFDAGCAAFNLAMYQWKTNDNQDS